MTKTYKREFAVALVAFWAAFCLWGVYEAQAAKVAEFITWPVLALAASAFGLDAIAKQFGDRK